MSVASGYTCPICMQSIMMNDMWVTRPNGKRIHSKCGITNNEVVQCGWCGAPLTHKENKTVNVETCEQAYGSACDSALNYASQLVSEYENSEE